ncbi:hypothetical protein SAMN02910353_02767 [Ruminococcus sp. YRD2003]|uniref:hypothetical protein n=1 Tax=Ruminococcus sp. YRD2003 TaxID=1452313 RepID=UPI0008C1F9E1|nr:hypothetical protein SAMN02910353_02767 [Ruminococcus flavefaciens]
MKAKRIKRILIISLTVLAFLLILVEYFIYENLKSYGYGVKELPETTLVYLHLSDGFTVSTEENHSVFIGRHSYIYDDLLQKKGYYKSDQMGLVYSYRKEGKDYKADNVHEFHITASNDWCHWFRVYDMSGGYKIEGF